MMLYLHLSKMLKQTCVLFLLLLPGLTWARVDLFSDDFERSSLNGGTHTYTVTPIATYGKAAISTQTANSGSRSMYICCDETYVTSEVIDLSGVNYAEISLWLRQGDDSFSEVPSLGDDLSIEVLLSNNTWQQIVLWEGSTATGGTIYNANIKIPEAAYHSGFRFRFYQWDGSGTSLTNRDFWHIDDLKVTDFQVGTTRYPIFYDGFERDLLLTPQAPSVVPNWNINRIDGNFTSEISNHTAVAGSKSMYTCCGERYTTTRDIDLSGQTFVEMEFWIRYGDDNFSGTEFLELGNYDSEDPSAAELYVQIYRADGVWETIAFHDPAASNSGEAYWYKGRVPDNAIHSAFKLRFYQADGSISSLNRYDFYHIDEVYFGTRDNAAPSVDHFRLSYGSSALTCNPQSVTIQACEDSSCSSLYTDPVDVTLSPTGWIGGDSFTINGGSATRSLSHTTAETITVGVSSSTPAIGGTGNLCSIDGGAFTTNCNLTFADSGLLVSVPDFLSAKGTSTATVTAVRSSNNAAECVPAFASVTKNINFWTSYDIPAAGSMTTSLGGAPVSTSSGSPTTVALSFNASGQATLPTVNYSDAGQKTLYARYNGSGDDAGLVMDGSDSYIARPVGLCVNPGGYCAAADSSCAAYKRAGESFNMTVTAVAWQADGDTDFCTGNSGTPNYSASNTALSSTVIQPAGGQNGVVAPTTYNHSAAAGGANTFAITESEVGVFNFHAQPPLYLGAALGTLSSTTPVVFSSTPSGRFTPDHYESAVAVNGTLVNPVCGTGNTYSGEAMTWGVAPSVSISAHNVSHAVTQNYTGGFIKLTGSDVSNNMVSPATDGTTNGTDSNLLALAGAPDTAFNSGTFSSPSGGVLNYVFSGIDQVTYQRDAVAEVAPFVPDLDFVLNNAITDSDGIALQNSLTLTPDASGISLRFGRLWLEDSYGPETNDLIMPMRTEYFDGTRYDVNTLDSCFVWDNSNATVDSLSAVQAGTGTLVSGHSGSDGISLQAPTDVAGTPDTGDANVGYNAPAWLEGDYDNDGSFEDPSATATFGVNRGHERLIYRKEVR